MAWYVGKWARDGRGRKASRVTKRCGDEVVPNTGIHVLVASGVYCTSKWCITELAVALPSQGPCASLQIERTLGGHDTSTLAVWL